MRRNYVDNIRWMVLVLLIPYHTCFAFNSYGGFYCVNARGIPALDWVVFAMRPWFMPVLFLIAGMSARFSLERRSVGQFAINRITKLVLPFISSMLILLPVQLYYMAKSHFNMWGSYGRLYFFFLPNTIKPWMDYGHFWFLFAMIIVVAAALPIIIFAGDRKLSDNKREIKLWHILVAFFYFYLSTKIFNYTTVFFMGRFFFLFLFGYFIMSGDSALAVVERWRKPLLAVALVLITVYSCASGKVITVSAYILELLRELACWFSCLAIVGIGKRSLNFENKFTKYMTNSCFAYYILHQGWLAFILYNIKPMRIETIWKYVLCMVLTFIATYLSYEIIRRIPGVRFLFAFKPPKYSLVGFIKNRKAERLAAVKSASEKEK